MNKFPWTLWKAVGLRVTLNQVALNQRVRSHVPFYQHEADDGRSDEPLRASGSLDVEESARVGLERQVVDFEPAAVGRERPHQDRVANLFAERSSRQHSASPARVHDGELVEAISGLDDYSVGGIDIAEVYLAHRVDLN